MAMYTALNNNDPPAYLSTISPNSRSVIKVENVLRSIIVSSNLNAYGLVEIDLGGLFSVLYVDMVYWGEYQYDGYVIVRASGSVNILNSTSSYSVCDMWDVRRYAPNQWFVDVEAPERKQRIERIVKARIEANPWLAGLPGMVSVPVGQWSQGIEGALQMCE
jgi:hypothetical protein